MSKEIHVRPGTPEAMVVALQALPDPGVGKKLIIYIRASEVRVHLVDNESTIERQDVKAGGGVA